ncbi:hypothetical protein [Bacillus sp. 1P06AnD]|uniref:hypothetical protein n=1 Tax=Bacillus sp. 1P06AnD TaxID=3132208 RepID=UPI00399F4DBF
MLKLTLQKVVTCLEEMPNNMMAVSTHKYKELPKILEKRTEILVDYPYGMMKYRIQVLSKLGFTLQETIWLNTHAPYGLVRQIWERKSA